MIKKYVFGMPLETGAVVFNELEGENGFAYFPDFAESGADGQAGLADAVQAVGIEKYFSLMPAGEGGEDKPQVSRAPKSQPGVSGASE